MAQFIINAPTRVEMIEKRSRFIGIAFPCSSIDQFRQYYDEVKSEFPDARHIAYAYKIIDKDSIKSRMNDAGEPSRTAGRPIFGNIEKRYLINTLIFVVRYFGGIKLGASGLVRAYSNTAKMAINEAELIEYIPMENLEVTLSYTQERSACQLISKFRGEIHSQEYTDKLLFKISIPKAEKDKFLKELTSI